MSEFIIDFSKDNGYMGNQMYYNTDVVELGCANFNIVLNLFGEFVNHPTHLMKKDTNKIFDIDHKTIYSWLEDEEKDDELFQQLVEKQERHMDYRRKVYSQKSIDTYINTYYPSLAEELGFFYTISNHCPLHKSIIKFNHMSKADWNSIKKRITRNPIDFASLIDNIIFTYKDGHILKHSEGTVICQPRRRYYYRGESAYFPQTKAKMYRGINDNYLEILIKRMRMLEFKKCLEKIESIKAWKYGDIMYDAIGQHYGIDTDYIDITSSLKIALFFSCCKYNEQENKWYPLTADDISNKNSRKDVYSVGGDSRYGIIMRAESELYDFYGLNQHIIPIGYQPFVRSSNQHGYVIRAENSDFDLKTNTFFEKYRFELTADFCKNVYEMMEHGKSIYPSEPLRILEREIKQINQQKTFTEEDLKEACEKQKINFTSKLKREFEAYFNVRLSKHNKNIFIDEKIETIDREMKKSLLQICII